MKVLYAGLLLWIMAWPGSSQATSCTPADDNYIMLCQQGGCFDGYRRYQVEWGSVCDRRQVVGNAIDKDTLAMINQVYLSSKFADQPGIYLFSIHQRAFWMSLKHPNYHALMDSYAKKDSNSRVRSNIETAKKIMSKNLSLRKPLNNYDALHKLHDSASSELLQQWLQEDIDEADFELFKRYFFTGLYALVLPLIGVILLFTTSRVIKPKFSTPTRKYFVERLKPMSLQVLIMVACIIYIDYVIWDMWLGLFYIPFITVLLLAELVIMGWQVITSRGKRSNR
ncbi:MAG: hypothetical protein MJK04_27310 [Psychrosphaera sp.]|nr:hypothetical protein [Psychrosphaera sp.]